MKSLRLGAFLSVRAGRKTHTEPDFFAGAAKSLLPARSAGAEAKPDPAFRRGIQKKRITVRKDKEK